MTHIYFPDNSNIYSQNLGFYVDNTSRNQGEPWYVRGSNEALGMAFVTLEDLGVNASQKYYGFSYFGRDVTTQYNTLTDVTTFPRNTGGDTADPYGGVASYFVDKDLICSISINVLFLFFERWLFEYKSKYTLCMVRAGSPYDQYENIGIHFHYQAFVNIGILNYLK